MPRTRPSTDPISFHKATGQFYVTRGGNRLYLGTDCAAAIERCHRLELGLAEVPRQACAGPLSAKELANRFIARNGSFRLRYESDSAEVFPFYVLQRADYEYEVVGTQSVHGTVGSGNRIVFMAPPPGLYAENEFRVQGPAEAESNATAQGGVQPRPVVVVVLTLQCTCTNCPTTCSTAPCRNIANTNVLTASGQPFGEPLSAECKHGDMTGDAVLDLFDPPALAAALTGPQ